MRATWEQVVDYARGLADEATAALVESDEEALQRVRQLRTLKDAQLDEAPEFLVLRAKALIPDLPQPKTSLIARLLGDHGALAAGYRSADAAARDLQFRSEDVLIDLRIEPLPATGRFLLVGRYQGPNPEHIRVQVDDETTWCTREGMFDFELADPPGHVTFFNPTSQTEILVNL